MAISHIGTNTQDAASGLNLTFTLPSHQSGDLLIAFVKQSENIGQQTWDDDGGGGNGWTRAEYNRTTGGRDMESAIYWKVATSSSETNPTFTWATGVTGEPMSGTVEVYRGCDTTTPIRQIAYANALNNASPPNPGVTLGNTTDAVLVFHGATHDDISSPAAPTGYTMRGQVWNGADDDHRNIFAADLITPGSTGSYVPPDWQHSTLNTTPEYHTYTVVLQEPVLIQIDDFNTTEKFNWGNTNITLTGFGFEATQGTGKVEIWSDASGTIKTTQTIDSWSDTSIQIDTVQGSLPNDSTVYVVVTNDNGDESAPLLLVVGRSPYSESVLNLSPDHYWTFDGNYNDTAGVLTRNASVNVGSPGFTANPLTRNRTDAFTISSQGQRIEIADSLYMNTSALETRTMGGWIRITEVQNSFVCFYEEGGGVNNLAFLMGMGGVLIAQLADTADDNVHAYSDFKLKANRNYHILFRFDYTGTKRFELLIDGIVQSSTFGNPLASAGNHLDAHSGDVGWGDAEGNLEVFGTDILFPAAETSYYQDWATFTTFITDEEAREDLFEQGVRGDIIISSDTQSAMQTAIDVYSGTSQDDSDCVFVIQECTDGDFELDIDNITFEEGTSIQIQYTGTGTLTLNNLNGSNLSSELISTTTGGTVTIITPSTLTINNIVNPTEVRVYEAGTQNEVAGQENVTSGTFSASISVSSVDVVFISLGYQYLKLTGVDTSSDASFPINQLVDRQYENV